MTIIIRTVNINAINEMAIRFGWRKPASLGLKLPAGWERYGRNPTRRTIETPKGVISTSSFMELWTAAGDAAHRRVAFGVWPEVVEIMAAASQGWEAAVDIDGIKDHRVVVSWEFDRDNVEWRLHVRKSYYGTSETRERLAKRYGINRWGTTVPLKVAEVNAHLRACLGLAE